jgi:hypothetical protein
LKHYGDAIGTILPPPGPYGFGGVSFANLTTGQYSPVWLLPPTGASFSGDSAEWIMELNDGGTGTLPVFTPLVFNMAGACNSSNSPSYIYDGDLITLIDPNPNTAESADEASVTITYVS